MNDKHGDTMVLTEADLEAIRATIFETVPINLMDTQKILIENKELKIERDKLKGMVALLCDAVKEGTGTFKGIEIPSDE